MISEKRKGKGKSVTAPKLILYDWSQKTPVGLTKFRTSLNTAYHNWIIFVSRHAPLLPDQRRWCPLSFIGMSLFLLADWSTTLSLVFGGCCRYVRRPNVI